MEITRKVNLEKKEIINAGQTTQTMQDFKGKEVTIVSVLVYNKKEENKEITVVTVGTKDAGYITSISPTVINSIEMICEAYDEKEIADGLKVKVETGKSNSNREFIFVNPV